MRCKATTTAKTTHCHLAIKLLSFNAYQTVRYKAALSSSRSISTGSPQGTVLSPILFTIYTNDCTGTDTAPVINYSDDCAIEDFSNSDWVYFAEVGRFSNWCRDNSFDLNVKKTKEMLTGFRKAPTVIPDFFIDGVKFLMKEWPSANI